MNQKERIQLLETYENGSTLLREALEEFPSEMWKYKPAPNRWSVHEIVIWPIRKSNRMCGCRMILAESGTTLINHEEYQWSLALNYHERDIEEALAVIRLMRAANFSLLRSVEEPRWENFCIHSVRGKMTLDDWLVTYTNHIPKHISQMQRTHREWLHSQGA